MDKIGVSFVRESKELYLVKVEGYIIGQLYKEDGIYIFLPFDKRGAIGAINLQNCNTGKLKIAQKELRFFLKYSFSR